MENMTFPVSPLMASLLLLLLGLEVAALAQFLVLGVSGVSVCIEICSIKELAFILILPSMACFMIVGDSMCSSSDIGDGSARLLRNESEFVSMLGLVREYDRLLIYDGGGIAGLAGGKSVRRFVKAKWP